MWKGYNILPNKRTKLGLIQSRGLGDIVIALPIARYYYDHENRDIYWPICEEFLPHVALHVPWVKWIPIPTDVHGAFFLETPLERLKNFRVDDILCLYQHLSGQDFNKEKYFEYTKFDQYKYIRAEVPFLNKWRLSECITRDLKAEQDLYDRLVRKPQYAVIHLEGSDFKASFDESVIPRDWQTIYITAEHTSSIFNWIQVINGAESIIMVDSCMANLTDQLNLGTDRYLIQRSHIGLTPVLGQHWQWLE
jgi:hypothetical protein